VPVAPDAETARTWLERELSDPIYQQGAGFADRFAQWLSDLLDQLLNTTGTGGVPVIGYVIGAALLAVVVVLALRFWAPALRQGRRGKDAAVFDNDWRTADQIDDAASAAARTGDFALAVVERYRGIVRRAEERVLIDDRAGRTALEAARDIGDELPDHAPDLVGGAQTFGAVLYGHHDATEDDYVRLTALSQRVAKTKALTEAVS
jgi:hypothetical protein